MENREAQGGARHFPLGSSLVVGWLVAFRASTRRLISQTCCFISVKLQFRSRLLGGIDCTLVAPPVVDSAPPRPGPSQTRDPPATHPASLASVQIIITRPSEGLRSSSDRIDRPRTRETVPDRFRFIRCFFVEETIIVS